MRLISIERQIRFFVLGLPFFFNQPASWANDFQPQTSDFSVQIREDTVFYRVFAVYVLPEERLTLAVAEGDPNSQFELVSDGMVLPAVSGKLWQWRAPREKGLVSLKILRSAPRDSMLINVFVMVPFEQMDGEYLENYKIGHYPSLPYKNSSIYETPRGFIEVNQENQEIRISPHFQLKQFLCKQAGDFPKYMVLQERLVLLLERILARVNQAGHRCRTLHIMSGYRTPAYNQAIDNVKYSCHIYGVAADFFIDENPEDGMMDDLNGDGTSDIDDAAIVYDLIAQMSGEAWFELFRGGLAKYGKTAAHGPFVHVDVRGFHARWGK
ncbi:hypothetical protein JXA02_03770 [candidate division KSB1 bacterium]|nr:hypothetical protein [candidate division KSB1 bacterium]RQW09281.1 MAG: hypothetical protein EH222_04235 [candidate division KSB1 bacterium]